MEHAASSKAQPPKKLIVLLIRHGIRNPKFIPEGWPLEKEIVMGEGALTAAGSAQSQELGRRIRERYGLQEDSFCYELVSTQSKRTIETARHFMKGMLVKEEVVFEHEVKEEKEKQREVVNMHVIDKGSDHILKRHRQQKAKELKKEALGSKSFVEKDAENENFFAEVRRLMKWENFGLKNTKSFNSLLYCYEMNGVEYRHLGVNDEMRKTGSQLANFTHNTIYKNMGWHTGEVLRDDIERRILESGKEEWGVPTKVVCYFAHDSTLGSFYYVYELDKKFSQTMGEVKFCSYFAIECDYHLSADGINSGSLEPKEPKACVQKVLKYVDFDDPQEVEMLRDTVII